MLDALYYAIFVLVPVFLLAFQAILLPVFFFLKGRGWLSLRAFVLGGAIAGLGFGYLFGQFSGTQTLWAPCAAVAVFGALSAAGWWYLLVKRERGRAENS